MAPSRVSRLAVGNSIFSDDLSGIQHMDGNLVVAGPDLQIVKPGNTSNEDQIRDTVSTQGFPRKFKPMDALTQSDSLREEDRALRRQLGFSEFYKGDIHNTKNQQAETADYENASLFLTNLPLFYSERKLILALLPHGPFDRIYATSVTPPGVGHNGSSAKVVTFTRRGAERLYAFIVSGQFIVDGRRVRCVWNSIKQRAPNAAQYLSRVMIIRVQKAVLDEKRLIKLLNHNLVYQLEQDPKFTPAQDDSDITQIEVRFCSFRAQAEAFRILLASEVPEAKVRFGIDPLADDPKHSANNPTVDKWAQLGRFRRGG